MTTWNGEREEEGEGKRDREERERARDEWWVKRGKKGRVKVFGLGAGARYRRERLNEKFSTRGPCGRPGGVVFSRSPHRRRGPGIRCSSDRSKRRSWTRFVTRGKRKVDCGKREKNRRKERRYGLRKGVDRCDPSQRLYSVTRQRDLSTSSDHLKRNDRWTRRRQSLRNI